METKRILVIDDEPDVLMYLTLALKDNGYDPIPANSAAMGLELLKAKKIDLVCLDVLMPRQTGITLYQTIREAPELKDIPVVIVTGLTVSPDGNGNIFLEGRSQLSIKKPDGIIEKPVDLSRFLETIQALLSPSNGNNHEKP
ncbi:response regulator [Acidobacteriota bacterium]